MCIGTRTPEAANNSINNIFIRH